MTSLRVGLRDLLERAPDRFDRSFLHGKPFRAERRERDLVGHLASTGLVSRVGASFAVPCARLTVFDGRVLATDLLSYRGPEQVFSPMFEQVYLIRNMQIRQDDDVLELCVGCGVNSLFAADEARSVCAVDLNPRALAFARFNEALNPGRVPLELCEGSLFEPLEEGRRFDSILVNPPFELVPPNTEWFLHSHGGEDGLDVVRQLLPGVRGHLAPAGRLAMITWTPGSETKLEVIGLCREALPNHHLRVHVLGETPISDAAKPFVKSPEYDAWIRRLGDRGLTHVHLVFVEATPSGDPDLEILHPEAEIKACYEIADNWA